MARYVEMTWVPADGTGLSRWDRQGGSYEAYVPDLLINSSPIIPAKLAKRAAEVERRIIALGRREGAEQLESIARLLMRSEAISSSRIEGIAPKVDKVILAELAQNEQVRGFKESAEAVARNLEVMRSVEKSFIAADTITVPLLESFQEQLLGANSNIPKGIRSIQNWIGGAQRSPIGADFIPAPPEEVPALMEDLCAYLDGAAHGALIQAGIVHAQFETIHPFADGNGRVGRALIHGTLLRRGLTQAAILPISLVLGTWSQRYVEGLTAFRNAQPDRWLEIFIEAANEAVTQANNIVYQLLEIRQRWEDKLNEHRRQRGKQRALRVDSIEAKLLRGLPAHPIVTNHSVLRLYGIGLHNARNALTSLEEAGILRSKVIAKNSGIGYFADDIIDLITFADRRIASSQFDTRLAPPTGRAVPE